MDSILKYVISGILIIVGIFAIVLFYNDLQNREEAQMYEENRLSLSPEEVIEYYYEFMIDRNLRGVRLTVTEWNYDNSYWRGRNIVHLELLSIEEADSDYWLALIDDERWLASFHLENVYDMRVFLATRNIQRREEWGFNDGNVEFFHILVRETTESPWMIHASGVNI